MTFKPIEHFGMYGMTKTELQALLRANMGKSARAKATRQACERIIFFKRVCGYE